MSQFVGEQLPACGCVRRILSFGKYDLVPYDCVWNWAFIASTLCKVNVGG
jgi:hypothetical protein